MDAKKRRTLAHLMAWHIATGKEYKERYFFGVAMGYAGALLQLDVIDLGAFKRISEHLRQCETSWNRKG